MKYRCTYYVELDSISAFLHDHPNVIATNLVKTGIPQVYAVTTESDYTEAETHMEVLNHLASYGNDYLLYLNDEEIVAMEYAIECIKTLKDMGIIK